MFEVNDEVSRANGTPYLWAPIELVGSSPQFERERERDRPRAEGEGHLSLSHLARAYFCGRPIRARPKTRA